MKHVKEYLRILGVGGCIGAFGAIIGICVDFIVTAIKALYKMIKNFGC